MARQKQDDQLEHTFSSYVRIRDVVLKTCQWRWTMGRSGERGSGISMLAARHDDENSINNLRIQDRVYIIDGYFIRAGIVSNQRPGCQTKQSFVSSKILCIIINTIKLVYVYSFLSATSSWKCSVYDTKMHLMVRFLSWTASLQRAKASPTSILWPSQLGL